MSDISEIWEEFELNPSSFCSYAGECKYRENIEIKQSARIDFCVYCQYRTPLDIPQMLSKRQGTTLIFDEIEKRECWKYDNDLVPKESCKFCSVFCEINDDK